MIFQVEYYCIFIMVVLKVALTCCLLISPLNGNRTHRTPAEIVDLLSLSIIIMLVQNTQEKRCQTQNLHLMIMLQQ